MQDKIKRFFECYIPVTVCNLRCAYCYIPQNKWVMGKMPHFKYTPKRIAEGFSKNRLGGVCYFSLCGGGETLLPKEVPEIVAGLLSEGHYVNITSNGTFTEGFDRILERVPGPLLKHLHFAFSFHYLELKRLGLLEVFSHNINRMSDAGCSFLVQLNLYDGYEPVLDEIKAFSMQHFGALPQVAATRREGYPISLMTRHTTDEYKKIGGSFNSPLFDFTMCNFQIKRKEFCYAGDWSFVADLGAGWIKPCYANGDAIDIFEDISKPIFFRAVGCNCKYPYCINSSHFLALGSIPDLFEEITYASLRNRKEATWYTSEMLEFLSSKLKDSNKEYSAMRKITTNVGGRVSFWVLRVVNGVSRRILKRDIIKSGNGFVR